MKNIFHILINKKNMNNDLCSTNQINCLYYLFFFYKMKRKSFCSSFHLKRYFHFVFRFDYQPNDDIVEESRKT
jgi:hypothetical protein